MTTLAIPDVASARRSTRLRWALSDGLVIARRNLTHVRHVPEKLLDVTLQPIMFVLLFAGVFGSAIAIPGGADYIDFLMGGIFVQTLAFATASTAVGVADDMHNGVIDRFRALPMARSGVLLGRSTADLAASILGLVVLAITGLAIGWSIDSSVGEALAGFGILLLFAYAMSWLGTLLGLLVRAADAAQAVVFLVIFPLTFVANTFVPTSGMPEWLRTIADWNPISAIVAACRELFGNPTATPADAPWPLQHPVAAALAWIALVLIVCVPLTIRRYRVATTR
jgi:ABC transporter DrrB family efflux protein